ncbi:hypothetical protein OH805_25910 [Streptomyces sp. NBC_00879]|uniref:hypothetical protein n=1 Tax=Streptomyces sp. NBC_00879 TaxID=2975855 RepID=UPI003870C41F|nr:hypothetical protein OH805_25910 [Streptomyces sp. NBC_00879]
MSLARRATPDDAEELVRLRKVMQDSYLGPHPDVSWQPAAIETLRRRLADPDGDLTAFVVERPGGLAACVVGTIEYRLGGPGNPHGVSGQVLSGRSGRISERGLAWCIARRRKEPTRSVGD